MGSIYDFQINGADHRPFKFEQYRGSPLLVINLPLSGKQSALPPSFEAARSVHLKYRNKVHVFGIPVLSGNTVPEERSIFAEYPVVEAVQVKNTFGGTMEPPLYHFLQTSVNALSSENGGETPASQMSMSNPRDRTLHVNKLFLCFLFDRQGRLVKVLPPDTKESVMDKEVAAVLNPGAAAAGGSGAGSASGNSANTGEMGSEELLRFIVDKVNEIFQQSYTLVRFDELRGRKLLQLVSDIFARLQPQLQMDLNSDSLEEAVPRMIEFLTKTLGYKIPPFFQNNFEESFKLAETTVIYPILYWTLSNMEKNEKRVYLARFLQQLDIPEDVLAQDEDVRKLHTQYQALRSQFIPAHRKVEELRKAFADPQQARRQVAALEDERDHIINYIKSAQRKIEHISEKDALLSACRSLRLAQEEDNKLAEKRVELQQGKISADFHQAEMSNRLQNLRRDVSDGRADVIIRRLKDEIQTNRIKLEEQLPLELERKREENDALRKLLTDPLDMAQLQSENQLLEKDIARLRAKVQERQKPGEDGTSLATMQQQMQRVQGRKAELMRELSALQADNNQAMGEIQTHEAKIAQLRGATQMLNGEEFKAFSQQVRYKRGATESMRTRLAETRAEWGTLVFTENVLKEKFAELDRTIGDLENKLGMQGYTQTLETLNRLTHEKDALEEMKGKTLEELSKVVQDMTMIIRDRRTKIAPLINELRSVREAATELEEEWAEKKQQYEYQESLLEEDVRKLSDTVTRLKAETASNESLFHSLHAQRALLAAQKKRVEDEKRFRSEPEASLDPHYKTYLDYYADRTLTLEQRTKDLQTRRRAVEENRDSAVQQVEWFKHLKKILEAKIKSVKALGGPSGVPVELTLDEEIDRTMGRPGVDMLVL